MPNHVFDSYKNIPQKLRNNFEIFDWKHGLAVLQGDFNQEWQDIVSVLERFRLPRSSILAPGGGKSPIAKNVNGMFSELGWAEKNFKVSIKVDKEKRDSPTHNVDYFKNKIAIEMEWNNKDPFFDRDLNNFRLLHELRVISVGIIITRSTDLQEIFDELGKGKSYGQSTTHWNKLKPKILGGGSGGCPVVAFAIKKSLYDPNL